jgi:GDP/UDP-N,N'-diacetylbacillosamine 2-epimerase (hydrolysing)
MRKVLYVTGTRADYGLMASTLARIAAHPALSLQVAVTGMHLSEAYGLTVREIEAAGLPIVARIPTGVDERSADAMAHGIGQAVIGLTDALREHAPDIVLLLGDRGEMLAGAIAALHRGIPIAHLHGGERSGTVDEPVRHAISKLSHWHFVATEESRDRLVRMGERPEQVWVTGAPSLDGIEAEAHLSREATLQALGLAAGARYALVLFHPVVQEAQEAYAQTLALRQALERSVIASGRQVVWLDPNADAGGGGILQALDGAGVHRIRHLARAHYLAALRHADLLAGNSSSGIIEAASLGTPVVNVGSRQSARQRNANTRDCDPQSDAIESAMQAQLAHGRYAPANVYGDGHAGERIIDLLAHEPFAPDLMNKVNTY